jgi:hypothetical protein
MSIRIGDSVLRLSLDDLSLDERACLFGVLFPFGQYRNGDDRIKNKF